MKTNEIIFPWPPKELNPNARCHWGKRSKIAKKYRHDCYLITKKSGAKITWEGKISAWIDFYPPDRRHRDDDNIISSFKSGRDGMADALGVNDKLIRYRPFLKDEIGGYIKIKLTDQPE